MEIFNLFNQAESFRNENTYTVLNYEDFKSKINEGGFIQCGWDGLEETEEKIKNDTKASIRCILFEQNLKDLKCIYSQNPAKFEVVFSKAY